MQTLLTGAGGYIGLHILRTLLANGHQVTAVVRSATKLGSFTRHPGLRIVETDLENKSRVLQALPEHHICVHAAIIWGDPGSELEVRDTAVAATLFDAAGNAGLSRCIYISSVAVHRPFSNEMCEEDSLNTTDFYGATKAAGELFLRAACAEHKMTGVVVRPGPVVGPPAFPGGSFRSPGRIAEMVAAAVEGRPLEVHCDGRQFSDVSMVARVVCNLTQTESPLPTYICVDRNIITWERVARLVVATLNSPSEVHVLYPAGPVPIPSFQTERVEHLNGGPSDAEGALTAHIRHLAGTLKVNRAQG